MDLGEAVVGERRQLVPDLVGDLAGDPALGHPRRTAARASAPSAPRDRFDPIAWRSWSASDGVNPATSIAICISCSWNSGTPRVLASELLEQRVQVGDRLLPVAAPDVGMHRAALDRAGPDQRDLDHEVVEACAAAAAAASPSAPATRSGTRRPCRPGTASRRPRPLAGWWRGRPRTPRCSRDQVDRVVQGAEHAEPEQVELHQPGGGAVVLVPLQHAALVHPAPLDRAHLDHRAVADHHPAGVDPEVARHVLDLEREVDHRLGDRAVVLPGGDCRPCPTRRPASTMRPAGRASARAPWPCRAPPSGRGR